MIIKKEVKELIPFKTILYIDITEAEYFKQIIIENSVDKILCYVVSIIISIEDKKSLYYDVGACRIKEIDSGNIIEKLDYGALYKNKEKAVKAYYEVIKEVSFDIEN